MVVPASSTSIIRSGELISRSISCVSLASERLLSRELLPASAFIISTRLLMLLDAGSHVALPFRTDVRLIRIDLPNALKKNICWGKLQFVKDFF